MDGPAEGELVEVAVEEEGGEGERDEAEEGGDEGWDGGGWDEFGGVVGGSDGGVGRDETAVVMPEEAGCDEFGGDGEEGDEDAWA